MSLVFPDVNVWLALASEEHTQRHAALDWWSSKRWSDCILPDYPDGPPAIAYYGSSDER